VRPKASWAGLICRTHQHCRRPWLPRCQTCPLTSVLQWIMCYFLSTSHSICDTDSCIISLRHCRWYVISR